MPGQPCCCASVWSRSPRSEAQEVGKLRNAAVDLQVFRPGVDSKGFITLNASQILGPKEFSFGLVSTWARDPLLFEGHGRQARSSPGSCRT